MNRYAHNNASEQGNVLFLILVAVALFAALSFAMTQSERSGGGDLGKDNAGIEAAQAIQYGDSIGLAITRMTVGGNVGSTIWKYDELELDVPGQAGFGDNPKMEVFHPEGGGASWQGGWRYSYAIPSVGTNAPEQLIVIPVTLEACEEINNQLSLENPPRALANVLTWNVYPGEAYGCVNSHGWLGGAPKTYSYYHTVILR